jgi:KDO2-lipid IV(A) lauroyltransferase
MFMTVLDSILIFFFNILVNYLGYLPLRVVQCGVTAVFFFLYPVVGILFGLRRRIVANLTIAYGNTLKKREARRIARGVIYNQLVYFAELFFYYHERNREAFRRRVTVEGLQNAVAARKGSKGVIGVTAHMGSFQLMMLRLSLEDDRFVTLIKELKSPILSEAWTDRMEAFGLRKIMMKNRVSATKEIMRELKHSAFVMFVADEFTRRGGHIVSFFGKETSMAAGPALVSLKMGVPLLPCFIVRDDTGRYRIIIGKPIEITRTGDYEADCLSLTQKRIEVLERYIRDYPDQWLWTQSRWKKSRYRKQRVSKKRNPEPSF